MNEATFSEQDQNFMKVALSLAIKSRRRARPNPSVGAVIVKNGVIIGQGSHQIYGEAHGEILALQDAALKGHDVKGATLYVTLEPCCHQGKTPPCTEAILSAGITRVVIAATDPNPLVLGGGVKMLRDQGVEVLTGLFEADAISVNREFHYWMRTKRPFGIMKAALTLDGKIATESGLSQWISHEGSRVKGHFLRKEAMAIMIGANTLRADNPTLSARYGYENERQPLRVVLSTDLNMPLDANLWDTRHQSTWVFTSEKENHPTCAFLKSKGVKFSFLPQVNLDAVLDILGAHHIDSVLFEGGSGLYQSALEAKAIQEAHLFYGTAFMGDHTSKSLFAGSKVIDSLCSLPRLEQVNCQLLNKDLYVYGQVIYPKEGL